jgi:predicted TIM-barrel fold metal-dependent hydrolase
MVDDAITAAVLCPNVYIATSSNATASAMQEVIKRCGANKVIYGSGLPYAYPNHVADKLRQLPGVSDVDLDLMLGGTMRRLLNLD